MPSAIVVATYISLANLLIPMVFFPPANCGKNKSWFRWGKSKVTEKQKEEPKKEEPKKEEPKKEEPVIVYHEVKSPPRQYYQSPEYHGEASSFGYGSNRSPPRAPGVPVVEHPMHNNENEFATGIIHELFDD